MIVKIENFRLEEPQGYVIATFTAAIDVDSFSFKVLKYRLCKTRSGKTFTSPPVFFLKDPDDKHQYIPYVTFSEAYKASLEEEIRKQAGKLYDEEIAKQEAKSYKQPSSGIPF